ncbi:OLC1v1032542C1 [Oldenlandia corymbosa var. corymbosa]|uniref:OLC1v1032542C1 n=1 Tax=Oldenlandia corymbosa var. corymbosa TaxID=529605 RepID=A0AAV1CNY7_OLDCO|nr:OLC1v1032542C1 [Oldenlandia corymbosa var. corymbosa]
MSSGAGGRRNGVHVLMFPFPAQGHILPMLDFTHQLAIRGLTITILVTPKNAPVLDPLLSSHPSIQTLIFPFPDHPSVPPGVENVKDIGNQGNGPIISALSKLHDPILQWFNSHSNPPAALISDFFLGWTHDLAHQIGIPRVVFYSSGAFSTAVMQNLWVNFDSITVPTSVVDFPDLPRSPSFIWEHLPSVFRRSKENFSGTNPDSVVVRNGMVANTSSWGAVFNTFEDLESEYLCWWRKKMGFVFAVGPLNLIGVPDSMGRGNLNSRSIDGGVLQWLDGCPDGSVLYVCFGSQKVLKKAQMEALAIGLENSGVRFIWVNKPVTAQQLIDGYGSVPDGFEDRVSGRGVVVNGWAPQVPILNHKAVGGFLSHFGMNSMLEAIVAGVVILGWPMEADQFIDERLLVDHIGAAVRVCQGLDTVPDPDALAQMINLAMRKDTVERERAKKLRNKALGAVQIGGSSIKDLDGFVSELAQLN